MIGRIAGITGRILLAAGMLILLFTAYQVWGTWLLEAHTQSHLRQEITTELPPGALAQAERIAAGPHFAQKVVVSGPPQVAPTTSAPATGSPVGIIDVPNIGLDQVVVEGVQTAQLRDGPGHYPGTPLPGQSGNAAIAGHRTTNGHPFYDLNAVAPGDRVVLTTPQGIFVYAAGPTTVVAPADTTVLADTTDPRLTLTTCNPRYSASSRLVLHATLVRSTLFAQQPHRPAVPSTTVPTTPSATQTVQATSLAGDGEGGWLPAVLWGLAAAVLAAGVWEVSRRTGRRWPVYLVGGLAFLVVLFFFFSALTPLLPASV